MFQLEPGRARWFIKAVVVVVYVIVVLDCGFKREQPLSLFCCCYVSWKQALCAASSRLANNPGCDVRTSMNRLLLLLPLQGGVSILTLINNIVIANVVVVLCCCRVVVVIVVISLFVAGRTDS